MISTEIFFIFLFVLISLKSNGLELSQWLYEDINNIKCPNASTAELNKIPCEYGVKSKTLKDVDLAIENTVFTSLAESEMDEVSCSINQAKTVLATPEIQHKMINETCQKLPMLLNAVFREKELLNKIKSMETLNNPAVFRLTPDTIKKNDTVISGLQTALSDFTKQKSAIVKSDALLGSPQIYQAVLEMAETPWWKGDFDSLNTEEKSQKINKMCSDLKNKLPQLVQLELKNLTSKKASLESFIKDPSGLLNFYGKVLMWSNGGAKRFKDRVGSSKNIMESTYCRLEARYGQGFVYLNKLATISSLGVAVESFFAKGFIEGLAAKGLSGAEMILSLTTVTKFGITTAASIANTYLTCKNEDIALTTPKMCSQMSLEETRTFLEKGIKSQSCATSKVLTGISTAIGGIGALQGIKSLLPAKTLTEVEESIRKTQTTYSSISVAPRGSSSGELKIVSGTVPSRVDYAKAPISKVTFSKELLSVGKVSAKDKIVPSNFFPTSIVIGRDILNKVVKHQPVANELNKKFGLGVDSTLRFANYVDHTNKLSPRPLVPYERYHRALAEGKVYVPHIHDLSDHAPAYLRLKDTNAWKKAKQALQRKFKIIDDPKQTKLSIDAAKEEVARIAKTLEEYTFKITGNINSSEEIKNEFLRALNESNQTFEQFVNSPKGIEYLKRIKVHQDAIERDIVTIENQIR